jgi:hypothetical protein
MDLLTCQACSSAGIVPVAVEAERLDRHALRLGGDHESRFFTCHVCGDNWLVVRVTVAGGGTRITFIHQMGMEPTLRRCTNLSSPVQVMETGTHMWDYFLGEDAVAEGEWLALLQRRRLLLRSSCSN